MEPSWPPKTEPRRSKIDVEKASKFDHFLEASWNEIFSGNMRPRGATSAAKASARRNARVAWGGLRRGNLRFQASDPRRQRRRTRKTSATLSSTPSRDGRRIASRIPLGLSSRSQRLRGGSGEASERFWEALGGSGEAQGKLWEVPGGSRRLQGGFGKLQGRLWGGSRGPRRTTNGPRRERGAGADAVPGSPGRQYQKTSIQTDQQIEDLTRLGP